VKSLVFTTARERRSGLVRESLGESERDR